MAVTMEEALVVDVATVAGLVEEVMVAAVMVWAVLEAGISAVVKGVAAAGSAGLVAGMAGAAAGLGRGRSCRT